MIPFDHQLRGDLSRMIWKITISSLMTAVGLRLTSVSNELRSKVPIDSVITAFVAFLILLLNTPILLMRRCIV